MIRKISLLMLAACVTLLATAQGKAPKWLEKQRKALLTVSTYGKDNQRLQTGTAFFVSETGEALSGYKLFRGAERAEVTDTDGKIYPVTAILGADDMYEVIRFQVETAKKVPYLSIATEPLANETKIYVVPYTREKKGSFKEGNITEVNKLKDPYAYYKTSIPFESVNLPLLTEDGEVFALMQDDTAGDTNISYGVSAGYANSLRVTSLDALSRTYSSIGIRKAWPEDIEQAEVMLMIMSTGKTASEYLELINDFITAFPTAPEGYLNRASHYAHNRTLFSQEKGEIAQAYLDKAIADWETASRQTDNKANVLFNKARVVFEMAAADTTLTQKEWTIAGAMNTLKDAIELDDQPSYRQLEGDMYFTLGIYDMAYDSYTKVNESELASSLSYYMAAKSLEQIAGTNISELIALLDKAIEKSLKVPSEETLTYILERIDMKISLSQHEEAVKDYDLYYDLTGGNVGDNFYYLREQSKFRSADYAGAMEDIQKAQQMAPDNPNYIAEMASIYMRQENYTEALTTLEKALALAPEFNSCYRLKGVCLVRLNKKAEACEAFAKAKELGDPVVDRLIREHCK
ncbi:tetratricopeptide (TPR) repeat protein [Parabacteroides sp. PFB2-10]|uniref:tetratricopeptide repeat-containing serine protease family protein n=1 Tax=Parabacteroides sp. PFB2-10 TaxID=1742405 RepID=UPI002477237E|nr:tetratricopeptide repeat-containing serine protease family protein [Parabacteroides sp. PFB2-10]MDH6311760.1 tetratricopeptide (TPR) repeat protein [Parabacteroides sp. PFB2-10]